jgi:hypothetical protein
VRAVVLRENPSTFDPPSYAGTGCADIAGEIHVCGGDLWHTIRWANGRWQDFRSVRAEVLREHPTSPSPGNVLSRPISLAAV